MDILRENHKTFLKNNKLILKSQQKFRSVKHNVFTEEVNKIALTVYSDTKMQSVASIETYAYGARKDLVCQTEET